MIFELQGIQGLLKFPGVGFLRTGQCFKPFSNLIETFVPGCFREAGVHFRVFVGFAGYGRFQIGIGFTDFQTGSRIAATLFLKEFQVTKGVSCFAIGGIFKYAGFFRITFNIGLACKIQVAPIGL